MSVNVDEIRVSRKKLEEIIPILDYLKATNKRHAAPYPTLGLEARHNQLFQVLVHSDHIENVPGTDSFYLSKNPLEQSRFLNLEDSQFEDFRDLIEKFTGEEMASVIPRIIFFAVIAIGLIMFIFSVV